MIEESEFVKMELERAGWSPYLPKDALEHIEKKARAKYARMVIAHSEWLEVRDEYERWANNSLKVIKKIPAERSVMTVTIPKRMADRINGVCPPKSRNKSAYVTRLLAKGWLSQMGDSE